MKRKHIPVLHSTRPAKKQRLGNSHPQSRKRGDAQPIHHPVLSCYYDRLITLRDYVVTRLGERGKTRKNAKLVKSFIRNGETTTTNHDQFNVFLDSVLVAFDENQQWHHGPARLQDFDVFSQSFPHAITTSIGHDCEPSDELQIEVDTI